MLNRNAVKIINTKDVKCLWIGILKIKKTLCLYRHISRLGAWVCLMVLIHSVSSTLCEYAGNTQWVIGLLREHIVLLLYLFYSSYSFPFICFTNLSLEFSSPKYWMKPGFSWLPPVMGRKHVQGMRRRWGKGETTVPHLQGCTVLGGWIQQSEQVSSIKI